MDIEELKKINKSILIHNILTFSALLILFILLYYQLGIIDYEISFRNYQVTKNFMFNNGNISLKIPVTEPYHEPIWAIIMTVVALLLLLNNLYHYFRWKWLLEEDTSGI